MDFEMLFLVIHEQTKLVVVQVITNDRNEMLHSPLSTALSYADITGFISIIMFKGIETRIIG